MNENKPTNYSKASLPVVDTSRDVTLNTPPQPRMFDQLSLEKTLRILCGLDI